MMLLHSGLALLIVAAIRWPRDVQKTDAVPQSVEERVVTVEEREASKASDKKLAIGFGLFLVVIVVLSVMFNPSRF